MAKKTNGTKKKTGTSGKKIKKWLRLFKKKPLLLITPVLIIIIIILAIALIASGNRDKTASGANDPNPEAETTQTALSYPYDDSKWVKEMKTGFMSYNDTAYTCTTGIDVSEWSLDIDWEKVKNAGISFVICRVGYRGYETGKFQFDQKFGEYLEGATAAGLKTGVYFVTQAVNEEEAVEEADAVIEKIKDYDITLPIYIDCEANTGQNTRTDSLSKEDWTNNAIAFCKEVEAKGYRGGVYSNTSWISSHLDMGRLTDYDIWFANYTDTPETNVPFNVWQYSATGSIDGITTDADLNIRLD